MGRGLDVDDGDLTAVKSSSLHVNRRQREDASVVAHVRQAP